MCGGVRGGVCGGVRACILERLVRGEAVPQQLGVVVVQ